MNPADREAEEALVRSLREGDETAFANLVDALHGRLLAVARTFTSSAALAEDIVQETWMAVIRGLAGFAGRSSLRTWITSILVRRARTMAAQDARRRGLPLEPEDPGMNGDSGEWEPGGGKRGLWETRPVPWGLEDPAAVFQTQEAYRVIETALAGCPSNQRRVVLLRDVEDLAPADICNMLEISETNQRVLLHRGRARIRRALDAYLHAERPPSVGATTTPPPTAERRSHDLPGSDRPDGRRDRRLPSNFRGGGVRPAHG